MNILIRLQQSAGPIADPSAPQGDGERKGKLASLSPQRDSIRIIHIQGVLDFGAIEQISAELAGIKPDAKIVILDLGHVTQCPVESRQLLDRQLSKLLDEGLKVLIARSGHLDFLDDQKLLIYGRLAFFEHLDAALEEAENSLIASCSHGERSEAHSDLELGFLQNLPPRHRDTLASKMVLRMYKRGDMVIRRGEPGDELFLVRDGCFTTTIDYLGIDGSVSSTRLATFGPGMCFGEISFVSGNFRSADVTSVGEGSCWVLDHGEFNQLKHHDPEVVIELLRALTFDLGRKLAQTSIQLTLLEHY
jgi:glutaminase